MKSDINIIIFSTSLENIHACNQYIFSIFDSLLIDTIKCRYNAVQFTTLLHTALWWRSQKVVLIVESQQTPHTLTSRVRYRVSMVRMLDKMDRVITARYCMLPWFGSEKKHFIYNLCRAFYIDSLYYRFNHSAHFSGNWLQVAIMALVFLHLIIHHQALKRCWRGDNCDWQKFSEYNNTVYF